MSRQSEKALLQAPSMVRKAKEARDFFATAKLPDMLIERMAKQNPGIANKGKRTKATSSPSGGSSSKKKTEIVVVYPAKRTKKVNTQSVVKK